MAVRCLVAELWLAVQLRLAVEWCSLSAGPDSAIVVLVSRCFELREPARLQLVFLASEIPPAGPMARWPRSDSVPKQRRLRIVGRSRSALRKAGVKSPLRDAIDS